MLMRTSILIPSCLMAIGLSMVSDLSAQTLGGSGTPGSLDPKFLNFQRFPENYEPLRAQFIGPHDIRTAVVQPDGKIVIGGSFRILKNNVQFDLTRVINVEWKNIARLNSDGTLDISFISKSAVDLAKEGYYEGKTLEWGPDQAVYSILVETIGDSYQYLVAGDFLNFSHSTASIAVPRLRYLVLNALTPNPLATNPEPLLELASEIAGGNGFDGPVRKMRKVSGSGLVAQVIVADGTERLALNETQAPIGTVVFQSAGGQYYLRVAVDSEPASLDWQLLTDSFTASYFAMGDFQKILDNDPQPYIVNLARDGSQLSVPDTWVLAPNPNARVNDIAVSADQNVFVGEFTTLNGLSHNRIGSVLEDGTPNPAFNSGTGFDDNAYAIDLDVIRNNMVVVGAFTSYNGTPKGRIVRLDLSGNIDPAYPAANNGNASGADGEIRALCRQPDGRLIIAGSFTSYNGVPRGGIARLERDGSLDFTFTPKGIAAGVQGFATDIDGGPGTASLFAKPVVIGNFTGFFGAAYEGIVRLLGGSWPAIWYQPSEINAPHSVEAGGSITLNVIAADNFVGYPGYPSAPVPAAPFLPTQPPSDPLFYQWQRNGANIPGANLSYLTLNSVAYNQAGTYSVKIYNSQYSVNSSSVQLQVVNPFLGIIPPTGIRVQGVIAGNPALNFGLGGRISFTVNRLGYATGKLTMATSAGVLRNYSFVGQFDASGLLQVSIPRSNMSPLSLTLSMDTSGAPVNFDFTDGSSQVSDGLNTAVIQTWNIPWSPTNPATPLAGKYNIGLDLDVADLGAFDTVGPISRPKTPQGHGYCTMSIPATTGIARIVGVLPDGAAFTTTSAVWGDANSTLPIWVPMYQFKGALQGRLEIDSSIAGNPVTADLLWTKPGNLPKLPGMLKFSDVPLTASAGSGLYSAAAFTASLPPAPSNFTLNFDHGIWTTLNGGLAVSPFSQSFSYVGSTASVVLPNPQVVSMSLPAASGLAVGSFRNNDVFGMPRVARFRGIILTQGGAPTFRGQFVMPNTAQNPSFYIGGSVTGY